MATGIPWGNQPINSGNTKSIPQLGVLQPSAVSTVPKEYPEIAFNVFSP